VAVRQRSRATLRRGFDNGWIEPRAPVGDCYQRECPVAALVEALMEQRESSLRGGPRQAEGVRQQRANVGRPRRADNERDGPRCQNESAVA
jgi:hypothetical protein